MGPLVAYLGPSLRRSRRRSRPWLRGLAALAVSLIVNMAVLWEAKRGGFLRAGPRVSPPTAVSLAPLSAAEWEANRRAAPGAPRSRSTPPPRAVPPPPPPPPSNAPGQVVDVAPSRNDSAPKDSRFVSDRNNTVEKETRSRSARPGYANTLPKPSDPKAAPNAPAEARERAPPAGEAGKAGAVKPGERRAAQRGGGPQRIPDQQARERLALQLDRTGDLRVRDPLQAIRGDGPTPPAPGGEEAREAGEGEAGRAGTPGPRSDLQLHPSASTYDRLAGGPAPDHLDGVEEGESTFLNTREWKYASYFNRIKQAVATQWDPTSSLRARDPTGERFAYKDRVTVVSVTLDDGGTLKNVAVQKSCGVEFLDRSAVEAFQKAQPFANPPRGLANAQGDIAFTFGFYLEVGSGLHIFRGPPPPGN